MRAAFSYPKRIAQEHGLRVVFLLDEFQEVARFDGYVQKPGFTLFQRALLSGRRRLSGADVDVAFQEMPAEFSPLQRRILRELARLRAEMVLCRTKEGYQLTDAVFARWLA